MTFKTHGVRFRGFCSHFSPTQTASQPYKPRPAFAPRKQPASHPSRSRNLHFPYAYSLLAIQAATCISPTQTASQPSKPQPAFPPRSLLVLAALFRIVCFLGMYAFRIVCYIGMLFGNVCFCMLFGLYALGNDIYISRSLLASSAFGHDIYIYALSYQINFNL